MPYKSYISNLTRGFLPKPPVERNQEVLTGAFGGVPARVSPTNVSSVFTHIPGRGMSGVSSPIAARPPAAPMLNSADYHSQIPGIGRLLGVDAVTFKRGTPDVHPAAVSDVQHVSESIGVHPTVARKMRQGG